MTSVGIILTPDSRSKAYIQKIIKNKIKLRTIILMNDERVEEQKTDLIISVSKKSGFDISKSVKDTLLENNLNFKEFSFIDINNTELLSYLKTIKVDYLIFTGGGILKHDVLSIGVKFIHLHPGILPNYRGSTCFYYSILNECFAGVSAYIMEKSIDTGDIILKKKFKKPSHSYLDHVFDPYIRSETLIELLKNKEILLKNPTKQNISEGETYFIIHPVLKHIAILSCV